MKKLNRRAILQGMAGAALTTPLLPSLGWRARAQAPDPRRMVTFFMPGGVNIRDFWPTVDRGPLTPGSMMGRGVEPLARHASKLLFARGLHCHGRQPEHQFGMAAKLTAANLGGGQRMLAQGPSVDVVASRTLHADGSDPLCLQIGSSASPDSGLALNFVSWRGADRPFAGENQPHNVYRRLMGVLPGSVPDTLISVQGQSIADIVSEDLESLRRISLSSEDRHRVDDWLDLVRDTENGMTGAGLTCSPQTASDIGLDSAVQPFDGLDSQASGRDNLFKASGEAMMRLAALAVACDYRRVVTLQWGHGGGGTGPTFRWDGMNHEYNHHRLSHRNGRNDNSGPLLPGADRMVSDIDRWYMTQLATLLDLFDQFDETDGTLLDNSVVAFFNEFSDGQWHRLQNLPVILAGSAGGYFKQGEVIDCSRDGNYTASSGAPHNRLLTTLLNAVGAKDGGGQPFSNFGQVGLAGEIDRLKRT